MLATRLDEEADPAAAEPPAHPGRLADASRVAREAIAEQRRSPSRAALRAPVRAIDVLLDELERVNLHGGAPISAPTVYSWLLRLEAEVGRAAPSWVWEVPDTVRLHAAILRWQGTLLDQCRPDRSQHGDMHEDPLDLLLLPRAALGPVLPGPTRRRVA